MKYRFKKGIANGILATLLIMMTTHCTDLTNGLSTDPVNLTDPSVIETSKYLSGVEVTLMGIYEAELARMTGMWAGYFSGEDRQYVGEGNYVVTNQNFDTDWVAIYDGIFTNTKILKQKAVQEGNLVTVGIAEVMEGMSIGLAADLWGDVPFSQITQYPTLTTPKFDSQSDVYAAAQALLNSGIDNLAKSGVGTGDFLLNGDAAAWIAVAHTVKARLYLHARDYANAIAQASSGIGSAAGNLMAQHGTSYLQTFNIYYSFTTYDRKSYMGADSYAPRLLDKMVANSRNNAKTDETARLNFYYIKGGFNIPGISYEPNVYNDFDFNVPASKNGFFGASSSFPIVTFQENLLILAEAYAKTSDPTNALASLNALRTYYATGAHINSGYLAAGYNYAQYVYSDFAPGGMENADNINRDKALLREILEERYVTLIGQIEGYNDMRRTHNFLNLPMAPGHANFPQRLLYSQIEANTNPNMPKTGVGLFDPVPSFSTDY